MKTYHKFSPKSNVSNTIIPKITMSKRLTLCINKEKIYKICISEKRLSGEYILPLSLPYSRQLGTMLSSFPPLSLNIFPCLHLVWCRFPQGHGLVEKHVIPNISYVIFLLINNFMIETINFYYP